MAAFDKVLVANRGEIAVRVITTLQRLGIGSVVVHHAFDRDGLAVKLADESIELIGDPPVSAYLDIEQIVAACRATGADAVHPGYGFLAENADLPEALAAAGVAFVGPRPEPMRALGDKISARRIAIDAGVSVLPGSIDALPSGTAARELAAEIGYPVILKASAGGGGKGMRIVRSEDECEPAFERAAAEAEAAFGDGRLLMERLVERSRHVEVQVLGDGHGNVVHLGERECSVQRRHQKLIEEAPCASLVEETRVAMTGQAVALARAAGYESAGTVELLLDEDCGFYFLEMNTRLQVEHGVTELVTGIDIVAEQLRVAAGEPLSFGQEDVVVRGHAVECRICAEDAEAGFVPSSGRLDVLRLPPGRDVRVDHGLVEGQEISAAFDSLLAKVLVFGPDRAAAVRRAASALDDLVILGAVTNTDFLARVLRHPAFLGGSLTTEFLQEHAAALESPLLTQDELAAVLASAILAVSELSQRFAVAEPAASIGRWTNT
jgi:propionyl-CoA carboxylase alpha chain